MDAQITTQWLIAVGILILNVFAAVALRWLWRKASKQMSEQELAQLQDWVARAVTAVEQMYNSGQLEKDERFKFALEYVKQKFPNVDYNIIKMLIEECIFAMKQIPSIAGPFDQDQ